MLGVRALVAGEDAGAVERLRAALVVAGVEAETAIGIEAAAATAARTQPQVVIALDGAEAALRERLDPLALAEPSPVIPAEALAGEGRVLALHLEARALAARVHELEAALGAAAFDRRRELEAAGLDALERLALAAEFRDDNTPEHPRRVAALAARLARRAGLPDRDVWLVRQAAPAAPTSARSRSRTPSSSSPRG